MGSCWVTFKGHDQGSHYIKGAAAAKSLQSCPTLCDPIDGSPPGSPVPGVLQARTLEWVAISFSNIKGTGLIFTDHSRVTFRCHDRLAHVPSAGYKGHRCLSPPLPCWDSDSDTDQGPPRLLLSKSRSSFPPGTDLPLPQPTFPFPFWPALESQSLGTTPNSQPGYLLPDHHAWGPLDQARF